MNHKKNFHKNLFNKEKFLISLILIFIVPIISFLSFFYLISNNNSKNHILGAATQYITGNKDTTYINTPGYEVVNGNIYKNGAVINIHGVNWFGFETDWHVAHGIDRRSYTGMMDQMKSIGVNAVRIPLCPDTIHGVNTLYINYSLNPDLQNLNSIQVLDKMINELSNRGMYVLLDMHRPDCSSQSELWYTNTYTETDWINDLKIIATRYKSNENVIGIDIKNEPHGTATWGSGNSLTDWNLAAERATSVLLQINSNILYFVEGISQGNNCTGSLYTNWGADFEPFNCFPLSSLKIPYNKLVLSPHIYGPDVYVQPYFNDSSFPLNIPSVMDSWFGYLSDRSFSITIGEWGGKYGNNGGDPKDIIWQNNFANYLISKSICNSFYWSWNPDSYDTGGILQDDWFTLWNNKVQLLNNYYNNCKQSNAVLTTTVTQTTSIPTSTPTPTQVVTNTITSIINNSSSNLSNNSSNNSSNTTSNVLKSSDTIISKTPVLTSTIIPTTEVTSSCLCSNDVCSNSCSFSNGNSNANFSCIRLDLNLGSNPTQAEKDNFCKSKYRVKGDADGNNIINEVDYFYYLRVVNGGTIPSYVFPDFDGDGKVSRTDRDIIIENIQK